MSVKLYSINRLQLKQGDCNMDWCIWW